MQCPQIANGSTSVYTGVTCYLTFDSANKLRQLQLSLVDLFGRCAVVKVSHLQHIWGGSLPGSTKENSFWVVLALGWGLLAPYIICNDKKMSLHNYNDVMRATNYPNSLFPEINWQFTFALHTFSYLRPMHFLRHQLIFRFKPFFQLYFFSIMLQKI